MLYLDDCCQQYRACLQLVDYRLPTPSLLIISIACSQPQTVYGGFGLAFRFRVADSMQLKVQPTCNLTPGPGNAQTAIDT